MRVRLSAFLTFLALLTGVPALAQAPAKPANEFTPAIQAEIQAAKGSMMSDQAEALRHADAIDKLARQLPDPRQAM
ncbi:MAG TPA: hypothetical protein VN029_01680, partial [Sphingomonas sp.]|nr:hypothetical protein [Sphingomonas sp.]